MYLLRLDGALWTDTTAFELERFEILDRIVGRLPAQFPGLRPQGEQKLITSNFAPLRRYSYLGGTLIAGTVVDWDGSVAVGLVFGPDAFFESGLQEPERLMGSLTLLDQSSAPPGDSAGATE
jgi:hypothetical protein